MQAAVKHGYDWKRVGREIRILKRLKNHPAIIHVYDVITLPSEVYVIQELAQGGSLLDFVRSRKRINEGNALSFFSQVVAGLQFCHANQVRRRARSCVRSVASTIAHGCSEDTSSPVANLARSVCRSCTVTSSSRTCC